VAREHDKNPELLFRVLLQLQEEGADFHISILGEQYSEIPGTFKSLLFSW